MKIPRFHAGKEGIQSMISSGNMRILVVLSILMLVLFVPVTADIIFPVKDYGFKISNMEDYPDYYVIIMNPGWPGGGYQIVSPGKYVDLGEQVYPGVYALRKTDYNPSDPGTTLSHAIQSPQFKKYSSENPTGNLTGVYETYRIVSINATVFDLARTERIFRYDDGSERSVSTGDPVHHVYNPMVSYSPVLTQESWASVPATVTVLPTMITPASIPMTLVPVTSKNRTTNDENPVTIFQYFILPLLALGIIAAVLIRRHKQ